MSIDEQAVKLPAIAELLQVSHEKVYRMAQAGEVPAFKIGREWRFFPSKVIAKLEAPRDPWEQSNLSRSRKRVA